MEHPGTADRLRLPSRGQRVIPPVGLQAACGWREVVHRTQGCKGQPWLICFLAVRQSNIRMNLFAVHLLNLKFLGRTVFRKGCSGRRLMTRVHCQCVSSKLCGSCDKEAAARDRQIQRLLKSLNATICSKVGRPCLG